MLGRLLLLLIAVTCCHALYANETCGSLNGSCALCAKRDDCFYCSWTKECADVRDIINKTSGAPSVCETIGWCQGTSCGCGVFPSPLNVGSMVILMIIYGVILACGAKMIADGSEDLLEVFPDHSTLIGGLLLPVLGVVPDGTMILVSGLFGTRAEAQEQVAVGMGTLAGSTIMLLTIPWSASLIIARTDIDRNGESVDGQLTVPNSRALSETGVTVDYDTMINARIAIGTSLLFLLGQVVAFFYLSNEEDARAEELEGKVSLAGFVLCMIAFFAYIAYQLYVPQLAEKRKQKAMKLLQKKKQLLTALLIVKNLRDLAGLPSQHHAPEATDEHKEQHAKALALKFGKKWKGLAAKKSTEETPLTEEAASPASGSINVGPGDMKESEEGEDSPAMTLAKSLGQMIAGALLVTLFSDPMVDAITLLGKELSIGAFYISFVVTPFCSNASELIAALVFAANKNQQASSMTYSQLYGAATMNSTLGLAIFYALIHFRGLAWTFSAETLSILLITWIVCFCGAFKRTFSLWWVFPNLALYPLSLCFVWMLEHFANWT